MWLLHTSTLVLDQFVGANIPPYAILSHTWGPIEEEVSFRDLRKDRATALRKAGYDKVQKCCLKAAQDGCQYVWIDTCCIDKRSSAELSEAINSMYKWYQKARVCYVYLADVPSHSSDPSPDVMEDALSKSSWFTRGWTLQELIAPSYVQFFGKDWNLIGTKGQPPRSFLDDPSRELFVSKLAAITSIKKHVLEKPWLAGYVSLAQRMSWAARRKTTREEDVAYALMGLFGVNMPILYGEGQKQAFKRLQLEIIKSSPDQSIFAWRSDRIISGMLAESPLDFADSGEIYDWDPNSKDATTVLPYSMTNMGLSINLPIRNVPHRGYVLATLRCSVLVDGIFHGFRIYLTSHLAKPLAEEQTIYRRERCNVLELASQSDDNGPRRDIYVLEDEQVSHFFFG